MVNCYWSAASRWIRRRTCSGISVRHWESTCSRCRMAQSVLRAGTGSAACTIRCWPRIPSSRWCSARRPTRTASSSSFPRRASDAWWFKVRDYVEQVRFGDPGWRLWLCAVRAQFVFRVPDAEREGRAAGAPALPGVGADGQQRAAAAHLSRPAISPRFCPVYEAAILRPACHHRPKIPALPSWRSNGTARPSCRTPMAAFPDIRWRARSSATSDRGATSLTSPASPRYHFCFGTLGGWPRFVPDDLGQAVRLANAFVAASGRRRSTGFTCRCSTAATTPSLAPLQRPRAAGRACFHLGNVIHNMTRFKARFATVRNMFPSSGWAPIAVSAGSRRPNCATFSTIT